MTEFDNAKCVWDFTLPEDDTDGDLATIKKWAEDMCKKWCFQLEEGASGYRHWQCRFSLKVGCRMPQVVQSLKRSDMVGHVTLTSSENRTNMFYVMKQEGRILGPFTDEDPYIPQDVRKITDLMPWQERVRLICTTYQERTINIFVENEGNVGKTAMVRWLESHRLGWYVPPNLPTAVQLMGFCARAPVQKCYIFDLPRAMPKRKLAELYAAIEQLKDGWLFDWRHTTRKVMIDPPVIWVFTNSEPNLCWLSHDRWAFWMKRGEELVKRPRQVYSPEDMNDNE